MVPEAPLESAGEGVGPVGVGWYVLNARHARWFDTESFDCPPGTNHVLVGAGDGPCVVVAMGRRPEDSITYPVDETARRHGASVEHETDEPRVAYAPFGGSTERAYRDGDLPELS